MALFERDLNVPRRPPPAPPTSNNISPHISKLPRRIATPPSLPRPRTPATRWVSSVAERIATVEQSSAATKPQIDMTAQHPPKHDDGSSTNPRDKPLPSQKPLPSRPIARLSNSLSPTKDSRCLIDASETPLHITSVAGEKHDWPTLRPQSVNLTPMSAMDSSSSSSPADITPCPKSCRNSSTTIAVTDATPALTNALRRPSSSASLPMDLTSSSSQPSSYATAHEHVSPERLDDRCSANPQKARQSLAPDRSPRKSVLSIGADLTKSSSHKTSPKRPLSETSLPAATSHHTTSSTESAGLDKPGSPNRLDDSRIHSPSPASFSQPRPNSASKTMKTASRIPIPDTKKATVVDVKKHRISTSTRSRTPPSFGSRPLASPEALKILENGKLRRQLKRTSTDASIERPRTENMWETESNTTMDSYGPPSLSHSLDTSPEPTVAPSSPEGHPCVRVDTARGTESKDSYENHETRVMQSTDGDGSCLEGGFEADGYFTDTLFTQAPPSKSPFTLPLQTIPSERILAAHNALQRQSPSDELVRALSHLEGKGSPPKTEVDTYTLLQMFGHVKHELDYYPQESLALAENAAVAEKYLAKNTSVPIIKHDQEALLKYAPTPNGVPDQSNDQSFRDDERDTILASKWSNSTPSDKAVSSDQSGVSPIQTPIPVKTRQSTARSKMSSSGTISIGYPSCHNIGSTSETAASPPTIHRRRPSPTLGRQIAQKEPGSVRAAREGMKAATSSFAHMTASSTARKVSRMPTPNTKPFELPETQARRKSSLRRSRARHTNGASPKTSRSQSKSRFVLDKINGIFSGKRDRKSQEIPPLPHILDTRGRHGQLKTVKESANGTPITSSQAMSQLPKMPSMSRYSQLSRGRSSSNQSMSDSGFEEGMAESQSMAELSMGILEKAKKEKNTQRKARLLNFAKVLNDALISVREAQISAEQARTAAKNARVSYELTLKSLVMLHKLASTLAQSRDREAC